MAPKKFELFKGRSREQADPPPSDSTTSYHSEHVNTLDSPVPSTSKGIVSQENNPVEIFPLPDLEEDEDYDEFSGTPSPRRGSFGDDFEDQQALYQLFQDELNQIQIYDEPEAMSDEEASTTYDAYSIQSDEPSLTESSKYCVVKKPKRSKSKEQELKDQNMWQASNYEVMTDDPAEMTTKEVEKDQGEGM